MDKKNFLSSVANSSSGQREATKGLEFIPYYTNLSEKVSQLRRQIKSNTSYPLHTTGTFQEKYDSYSELLKCILHLFPKKPLRGFLFGFNHEYPI